MSEASELGARLRERDLSAAPAVLNLVETRTRADEVAALLREVSPAALGGEAPGHLVGITGPPAAGEQLGGLAPATRAAAQALSAAFDVVVIETVGVGQSETDVAEVADTVAVIVQPGSGDALQFIKAGIMDIPDVLVVTKADLGQIALRARRDLHAALRSVGARDVAVIAVSSISPVQGIDELLDALEAHRARLDVPSRRLAARRHAALADFHAEHGERGLRSLGGRRAALRWLAEQDDRLEVPALVRALSDRAANGPA